MFTAAVDLNHRNLEVILAQISGCNDLLTYMVSDDLITVWLINAPLEPRLARRAVATADTTRQRDLSLGESTFITQIFHALHDFVTQ